MQNGSKKSWEQRGNKDSISCCHQGRKWWGTYGHSIHTHTDHMHAYHTHHLSQGHNTYISHALISNHMPSHSTCVWIMHIMFTYITYTYNIYIHHLPSHIKLWSWSWNLKKKISFSLFLPFPQPPSPRFLFPKLEAGGQPHRLPCGSFLSLLQTGNLRDNDGSNFNLFQEMSSSFNEWKSPSRGSVTGRDKASSKWHPVQLLPAAATLGSPWQWDTRMCPGVNGPNPGAGLAQAFPKLSPDFYL